MSVKDKLLVDDKIVVSLIAAYSLNYTSFLVTTLMLPPLFLISYYCQLLKQVDLWHNPYVHKPFQTDDEKSEFIISRMIFCLIVLSFMHFHYYLTQLDISEIVIEKELMKRQ